MALTEHTDWFSAIAALLGLWAVVSPFALSVPESFAVADLGAFTWSNVVIGLAVLLLAGYVAYRLYEGESVRRVPVALATLGGLLLVVTPFVFGATGTAMASNVIAGLLIAVFAGYTLYTGTEAGIRSPGEPTA